MNSSPLVSIVIPTYNHAHFIGAALRSVVAQSYSQWEVIVVNNFSTDNTVEVVANFNDPRIRLINFHNHGVIAASRNEGIRHSKGVYVAFLDSDDIWYPEKLAHCVDMLEAGGDVVCHGERWVREGVCLREVTYGPLSRAKYSALLYKGNCLSTSATVVRKIVLDSLGGFDEEPSIIIAEDYDLWLRIARISDRFAFLPQMLGEYTIHSANCSGNPLQTMRAEMAVIERHFERDGDVGFFGRINREKRRAILYYAVARGFYVKADDRIALSYFWKAIFTYPFLFRIYPFVFILFLKLAKRQIFFLGSK